ncbi:heterogeneous nuclear ribonucleoproteins A2/B1-like [Octopus sinensis]|uniref:Heterogeneous nuclear ribonucleoproteins A2/B1-like n=1 Tax=Octopus sinensis TaxID=2607531 RepID=A0A6P7SKY2_9MOLL|nr:heterogeneous nuclear ribonucleoproteins A2/B1-like [Octopus sinensis]
MEIRMEAKKYRKLFVGGLSRETNEISLKTYFEQWGKVLDCVVVRNPATGVSKGFSFLVFKEASTLDEIQSSRPHIIDNRCVETRRAMPYYKNPGELRNIMEIYAGRFRKDIREEEIWKVFSNYGSVQKLEWVINHAGKYTGFVFLCFDDIDSVDKCVLHSKIQVDGRQIVVTRATRKKLYSKNTTPKNPTLLPSSFLRTTYQPYLPNKPGSYVNPGDESNPNFQYQSPPEDNYNPQTDNIQSNPSYLPLFYPQNFHYLTPKIPFVATPYSNQSHDSNLDYFTEQQEYSAIDHYPMNWNDTFFCRLPGGY